MIMPTDQRQSRFLAVALAVVAGLLVYMIAVQPWLGFRTSQKEVVDDLRFQLGRYQQLAGRQEEFETALARAKGRNGSARYYLAQSKPALASAELEQYLETLLRSGNAQILSTQAVSNAGDGAAPSVAVKVRMRSDLMTLVGLLYRIETGSPAMFVGNLVITRHGVGQSRISAVQQPLLEVQFDMIGFLREST